MTEELNFSSCSDKAKITLLKEAVDRADALAFSQAKLISTQEDLIETLKRDNYLMQSEIAELKIALSFRF
ncbi:MAG: hypothetical protein EBS01_12860, partial [Verrucomicrobia bacterium]|nr:hypothetical protein [Verrucomicrobiota bacterium]